MKIKPLAHSRVFNKCCEITERTRTLSTVAGLLGSASLWVVSRTLCRCCRGLCAQGAQSRQPRGALMTCPGASSSRELSSCSLVGALVGTENSSSLPPPPMVTVHWGHVAVYWPHLENLTMLVPRPLLRLHQNWMGGWGRQVGFKSSPRDSSLFHQGRWRDQRARWLAAQALLTSGLLQNPVLSLASR